MPKTKKVKADRTAAGWGRASTGPEWHLPATAADYDAMVEQMAMAMATYTWAAATNSVKGYWRNDASRALRAIGINRPKEGK